MSEIWFSNFRKRADANLENKKDNTFRIFIVGGSTVLGDVLETNDPISARIEKLNENYGELKILMSLILVLVVLCRLKK